MGGSRPIPPPLGRQNLKLSYNPPPPLVIQPAYINATMTANKDNTWSTFGSQVLHIVPTFSDHYAKGKVFFPLVVGGAPELLAASSVL